MPRDGRRSVVAGQPLKLLYDLRCRCWPVDSAELSQEWLNPVTAPVLMPGAHAEAGTAFAHFPRLSFTVEGFNNPTEPNAALQGFRCC